MRLLKLLVLTVVLLGCGKPLPDLEGVNLEAWKDDKKACGGKRALMETALQKEKEKLKGLSEMDIVELLGRPDENELYKRNQKFFSYYVTAGPDCEAHEELPHKLIIRFNAMGYAQLVTINETGQ